MKETNMGWITERFYRANRKARSNNTIKRKNTDMWTREKATDWIQRHQYIDTDGDFEHIVMDGDGQDLYAAISELNKDFSPEELGKLLVFVFNDYIKLIDEMKQK